MVLVGLILVCPLIVGYSSTPILAVVPEISNVDVSQILEVTANITIDGVANITELLDLVGLSFQLDGYWYVQEMAHNFSTGLYHFLLPAYNQLGDKTIQYYVEVKTLDNQTVTSDVNLYYVPAWVRADLNRDGKVDMRDIGFTASNFQQPLDSLFSLPANALLGDHRIYSEAELLRIDVDPAPGDQQETSVSPGQTIDVNLTLHIWEPRGPSILNQALITYSWSPTWPPTPEYYTPLYHGTPSYYPGVTVNRTFNLTVPTSTGEYYLWFCAAEQYNMEDAAGTFTEAPYLPAYARIIVT